MKLSSFCLKHILYDNYNAAYKCQFKYKTVINSHAVAFTNSLYQEHKFKYISLVHASHITGNRNHKTNPLWTAASNLQLLKHTVGSCVFIEKALHMGCAPLMQYLGSLSLLPSVGR